MSSMFSKEQEAAINSPGNVIVSAGAGSGKTTVMVERVAKKLLAGHKLDKMLIVTFTRASAADIRVKLAERLTRLKREASAAEERKIATEALESLPVCNIGTLHSFCQKLIRTYYYAAGVDPAALLTDEDSAKAMKGECIRRAIRSARDGGDKVTTDILDALSGRRDDEGAAEAVLSVLEFALSLSDTRGYLSHVEEDSGAFSALDDIMSARRERLLSEVRLLAAEVAAAGFKNIERAVNDLFGYIDFGYEITHTQYRGKDIRFAALNEIFKALKEDCKKYRADLTDVEAAKKVESSPYARAVAGIALDALNIYEARKAALGIIDYADLEHGALAVLSDGDCMKEIAAGIDFVFIDEYQDVNPLQAEIAAKLKNDARAEMFLVGDIKQSIYAFRRCNPVFFQNALTDPDYTRVDLNRNYRSSKEVIDLVNNVFTGVMRSDFGGADYTVDKLVCGRSFSGEADFYVTPEKEKKRKKGFFKDCFEPYSVVNAKKGVEREDDEARLIADLILDYVESGKGGPGSIAVLVRSARTAFCDRLVRLLRANGIPCNFGKKSSISDYPEAEALLLIARCIDNRFDDVALYTALRSSMGGFSDDELYEIGKTGEELALKSDVKPECGFGTGRKSYYFWQKVHAYMQDHTGKHSKGLKEFFDRREKLSAFSKKHDAADALGKITGEIDFFQYVMENGGSPAAVEALISLAADKKCSLAAFLEVADGAELNVCDGGDAVTISTIHASKGLEYDFVIVADIGKKFNMRDASNKCTAAGGGVTVIYPDSSTRTSVPSARWLLEKYSVPDRLRAEELRLFYVALTRAKKKLVVCGSAKKSFNEPDQATSEYDFMKNIVPKTAEISPRKKSEETEGKPIDSAVVEAVKARINAEYNHDDAPIKTCVTAIAESSDDDTYPAPVLTYDDRDGEGEERKHGGEYGEDAARRGTAYHKAMELIDFDSPDVEGVKRNMRDGELVDFDVILKAASEMKELVRGARAYFKERYFIADLSVGGESALVQGVIDLLIINPDGTATIVDYKTTAPEYLMSENYLKQLALYAAAVEKSSPLKVSSAYLYSFALGKTIKCNISR